MTTREEILSKVDYEPYFERWDSVIYYPHPEIKKGSIPIKNYVGEPGVIPAHRHKTCMLLTHASVPQPPRVCPWCGVDTAEEQKLFEKED